MMSYKVTYYNDSGKKEKKVINVDNDAQLQPYIHAMELNVVAVEPVAYRRNRFKEFRERPKMNQIIEIIENLQVVVKSGLPMNTALLDLAHDADTPFIREMLMDVAHRIQMSMSLSEAMSKYMNIFGETTLGLVRIGEETGQLDETLANAAEYLGRMAKLTSKVKSALISPAITLTALFGAMLFWIIVVLPQVTDTFKSLEVTLPTVTVLFLRGVEFFKAYIIYILLFTIIATVSFFLARKKSESFRYKTDNFLLNIPILGNILSLYNFAFVAEYTRLMIAAGLPLFQALGILVDSLGNRVFRKSITNARTLISDGSTLSRALSEQHLFSPLVVRMVSVGEQTGRLEGQLKYVSDYYFSKVDVISENIAQLIQPFITVVLGLFMVIMMVAFLVPIFDLVAKLSAM